MSKVDDTISDKVKKEISDIRKKSGERKIDFKEKLDLDELHAMLAAASASHSGPKKETRTFLKKIVKMAFRRKENFIQGNIEGLPIGWGVNSEVNHWSKVTPMLYHSSVRIDIGNIRELVNQNILSTENEVSFKRLFWWFRKFRWNIEALMKYKELVNEERLVYGFMYRVNTRYTYFWSLLDQIQQMENIFCNRDKKGINNSLINPEITVEELTQLMSEMCLELEICMNEEDELLSSLLKEHFSEEDEHESIVCAAAQLKLPSEGIVMSNMTHTMYHWVGAAKRQEFLNCLAVPLRWAMYSITSKERDENEELLKSVYCFSKQEENCSVDLMRSPSVTYQGRNTSNLYPQTPKNDSEVSSFVAMAV